MDLNQTDAALELARRAVSLEPGASYHRVTLARVLSSLSKRDEALKEAERALALARDAAERQRAENMVEYLKRQSR